MHHGHMADRVVVAYNLKLDVWARWGAPQARTSITIRCTVTVVYVN